MKITRLPECALIVILLGMGMNADAATTAQIDSARANGLRWLFQHQTPDGSWKSGLGSEIAATSEALEAIRNAGLSNYPYHKAISWLSNTEMASVDSLARATQVLWAAGMRDDSRQKRLVAWKNNATRATWGAYERYMTSFPDTPMALAALRASGYSYTNQQTEIQNAVYCDLLPAQRTGGAWSYTASKTNEPTSLGNGSILPTSYILLELKAIKDATGWDSKSACGATYSIQTALNNGVAWLISKRNADGGFGDSGTSGILETALAYQALKLLSPADSATTEALDFLLSKQNSADGGWEGEALQTALTLKLLPSPSVPLADADWDGIPDAVEVLMGSNAGVNDSRNLATVNGSGMVVFFTPYALDGQAYLGKPYSYDFIANGGTPPYTWNLRSGTLPPGVNFNGAAGQISGTPNTLGSYEFAYSSTDSSDSTDSLFGRLEVVAAPVKVPGDLNGDGVVNGKDHALIMQVIDSILLAE